MTWNNDTQSYRGETSDGKIVDVTGDEWSESVQDGMLALAHDTEFYRDITGTEQLKGADYDAFEDAVLKELDDPDMWAGLAGDNPNVEIIG